MGAVMIYIVYLVAEHAIEVEAPDALSAREAARRHIQLPTGWRGVTVSAIRKPVQRPSSLKG